MATQKKKMTTAKSKKAIHSSYVSNLEGHIVVSEKEGSIIGEITNVYFNFESKKISAVAMRKHVMGERFYTLTTNITSIGEDVLFVKETTTISPIEKIDLKVHRDMKNLKGIWITTLAGKHLGHLEDIEIDLETLMVSEFYMTSGKVLPVDAKEITLGKDEILVPEDYEDKMQKNKDVRRKQGKSSIAQNIISNISQSYQAYRNKQNSKSSSPAKYH